MTWLAKASELEMRLTPCAVVASWILLGPFQSQDGCGDKEALTREKLTDNDWRGGSNPIREETEM